MKAEPFRGEVSQCQPTYFEMVQPQGVTEVCVQERMKYIEQNSNSCPSWRVFVTLFLIFSCKFENISMLKPS